MSDDRWPNDQDQAASGKEGPPTALIVGLAVLVVTVIFVLSNRDDTRVRFLGAGIDTSTWVLILVSLALGAALDRTISWWRRRRRKRRRD